MSLQNLQKINWQGNAVRTVLLASVIGLGNGLFQLAKTFAPEEVRAVESLNLQNINLQGIYDVTVSALIIVIPAALSWYARTYLKSADNQKRISMMTTLASAAINYAEDCERRGERELAYYSLDLPESLSRNSSPGHQKLCLASSWLVEELKKVGIKRVSLEEATKWVASEFQKNIGDLRTTHSVSSLTDSATNLLNQLSRAGHITLPSNTLEAVSLIQSIADWATNQLGDVKGDKVMQREAAMARISPSSLMTSNPNSNGANPKIAPEMRLSLLARQATEFVKDLQKKDRLKMSERDTAMAWLIQKVQQDDIPVTRDQIGEAISIAFEPR